MPYEIREIATGTLVHGRQEVLLGKKERELSWRQYGSPLRWVFYGGKIKEYESPMEAFVREMGEESGLVVDKNSVEKVAMIFMKKHFPNGDIRILNIHMFLAHAAMGLPRTTREIEGWRWCNQGALPLYAMLAADRECMPLVFKGKKIVAEVEVDNYQRYLLKPPIIQEVESFSKCPSLV